MHPLTLFRSRAATAMAAALLCAAPVASQDPSPAPRSPTADSIRARVAARRAEIARTAETFLDRGRSAGERAQAGESVPAFIERAHVAAAAQVARDPREDPHLRALAHTRIRHAVGRDSSLALEAARWVRSRETPRELRLAALGTLESLLFSFTPHTFHDALMDALRAASDDTDAEMRRRAFSVLAAQGDTAARARLREGLRSPAAAPLPPRESVRLLGLRLDAESLPVLHAVMLAPPDPATRLEAVRLLGGYAPSRPALLGILRDRREGVDTRLAAMGALQANAPDSFPAWAVPVVEDEEADDRLRIYAIQAVGYRRPFTLRLAPDPFDAAVSRLSTGSRSAAVRRAAGVYVRRRGG